MNIIIITILSTIFGVCLVAFLTWLGITSFKLMKFKKNTSETIQYHEKWIKDSVNDINDRIYKEDKALYNKIIELNKSMDHKHVEIYGNIDTQITNLNSKIDSRCDKLQASFSESYNMLFNGSSE